MMYHAELVAEVMLASRDWDDVRLWPNPSGTARSENSDGSYRYVRYGAGGPGASDLIGFRIINGAPVFAAIELKAAPTDRLRPKQKAFLDSLAKLGCITGVAHTVEEVREILYPSS